jgi:hypothetical protein
MEMITDMINSQIHTVISNEIASYDGGKIV